MLSKPKGFEFVYFDWDREKVTVLFNDDPDAITYPNLRELIEDLDTPTVLIGESTFESYNLQERKAVYDLAIAAGHKWYGTANRLTYRWRNRFGWEKSDANDVTTIRIIAEYPGPLSDIRGYKQEGHAEVTEGQKTFVYDPIPFEQLDVADYLGQGHWTRLREIKVDNPEESKQYEMERREVFRSHQADAMDFRRSDEKEKAARYIVFKRQALNAMGIDPGKTAAATNRKWTETFTLLNNSVMWAIVFAAQAADSREEFEALLGAHAHGAKSMLRSQFYHWGWAGNGKGPMNKGAKLSDYRRQVRKLGALVVKHQLEI